MRPLIALLLALTLVACAQPEMMTGPKIEAEAADMGVVIEEAPMMAPKATKCAPGEGDGIGGTGCAID